MTDIEDEEFTEYVERPVHNTRDMHGNPLVPGVNVDPVNIAAGLRMATQLGYSDPMAQMVAQYALQRHQRGEEAGAQATWLHEYPRDLTSWYAILAHAVATPEPECTCIEDVVCGHCMTGGQR